MGNKTYELSIDQDLLDQWMKNVEYKTYYQVRYSMDDVEMAHRLIKNMQDTIDEIHNILTVAMMRNE